MTPTHRRIIDLLLASVFRSVGEDGQSHSFFYGKPGAPHWQHTAGVEIFVSANRILKTALFLRQLGPSYLKSLSIHEVERLLTDFLHENFYDIGRETFLAMFPESYCERVSDATKAKLATALQKSRIFEPQIHSTFFPLVTLTVEADFTSKLFFLRRPETLPLEVQERIRPALIPSQFPPVLDWKGKVERPASWLGVRSPAVEASVKLKKVILGAIALTPQLPYRYMFSGREMFGGRCTIESGYSMSYGEPHTPPLMNDITIRESDHVWLSVLASKLESPARADRRQLAALEYYYRSWPLPPSERFAVLCMALDGAFSEARESTKAVVDGVRSVLGEHVSERRLRDLMDLRASVIHGGAPDVHDSRKYAKYYGAYEEDPIHDLDLVVAECLRRRIFGATFVEQPDPYEDLKERMQASGRIPKATKDRSILALA